MTSLFEFVSHIIQQNSVLLFTVSLDIDSLFTNIPVDETRNVCIELLFKENNIISVLNNKQMFERGPTNLKE